MQAAILNLLADLQAEEKTSYVFITHDMGVVRYLADRIAVMYLGRIQEVGPTDNVFNGPNHPYTEALLSAIPSVDGEPTSRIRLEGEIPSPANPPTGCVSTRVPARHPRRVRGDGAAVARGRARPRDAVSHPDRRASRLSMQPESPNELGPPGVLRAR